MHKPQASSPQEVEHVLLKKIVSGGLGCMMSSAILNPMDVTKVRMQMQKGAGDKVYTGFVHGISSIAKAEGLRGLFAGLTASMMREASYSSIRMGMYDHVKEIFQSDKGSQGIGLKLATGMTTGAIGAAIANPTDLVKTRFQAVLPGKPRPYSSTFAAFASIYRNEGLYHGLYRGVGPTTSRAAVLTAAQLGGYDIVKNNFLLKSGLFGDNFFTHVTASMIAGIVTTTATQPFDTIKTRIMNDYKNQYKNPIDCVIKCVRNEGPFALMKGWTAAYFRIGPHTVISIVLMETIRKEVFGIETV